MIHNVNLIDLSGYSLTKEDILNVKCDRDFIQTSTIIGHLKKGVTISSDLELDTCPFNGTTTYTTDIMTDGVWAWTNCLIYYVENYSISLPASFIAHISNSLSSNSKLDVVEYAFDRNKWDTFLKKKNINTKNHNSSSWDNFGNNNGSDFF